MASLRARENARLGIVYLQKAVLEVLSDAGKPLTTRQIMEDANIPRAGYDPVIQNGFADATLGTLLEDGLVELCPRKKGEHNCWQLTPKARET